MPDAAAVRPSTPTIRTPSALAQRAGLTELVAERVRPGGPCEVNAPVKIGCLVAGMIGGADSIDDMDLLRHGAMDALFSGVRGPSTLGPPALLYPGNVRHLRPAGPGAERAGRGHLDASVGAGDRRDRLRGGNAASARGTRQLRRRSHHQAREAGCTGTIMVRMDSAYYAAAVITAIRRAGAYFSVTAWMDAKVAAAIAATPEDAWTAIRYPRRSGMTSCAHGFPTPKSPRRSTRRSRRRRGRGRRPPPG